ncbi:hypothetical protein BV392_18650 [Rhodovulum sulfidophilum]|nr:hypothetical protein BV392_18650 [Rhodovulum sulfidophilum]
MRWASGLPSPAIRDVLRIGGRAKANKLAGAVLGGSPPVSGRFQAGLRQPAAGDAMPQPELSGGAVLAAIPAIL